METKLTRRPWRSRQPKLRRRHKFGRHLQKCFWKAKVLLESKNTSGKEKYFWQGKILLARKTTFGKQKCFWQGKILLARDSDPGEKLVVRCEITWGWWISWSWGRRKWRGCCDVYFCTVAWLLLFICFKYHDDYNHVLTCGNRYGGRGQGGQDNHWPTNWDVGARPKVLLLYLFL